VGDLAFGLQLTAQGMGLVFGLLALLWGALELAGRVDRARAARAAAEPAQGARPPREAHEPLARAEDRAPEDAGSTAVAVDAIRAGPLEVRGAGAADLCLEALAAIAIAVAHHAAARRRQAAPETRSARPGSLLFASRWLASGRAKQTRGWTPRR
jgi:Na+-transporting methylmalonyl-CoA/oxaloacetate decarboxylase gamma subunit